MYVRFCKVLVCVCLDFVMWVCVRVGCVTCGFCNVWVCVYLDCVKCVFFNVWLCVCVGFVMCGRV